MPERKQNKDSLFLNERRQHLSPLAITKRCIPYEPRVFHNRSRLVLNTAQQLNTPETRVLLLEGPQGVGKSTFMRGLAELMGGGDEQLFWLDIHPMSSPLQLIDTLVRSVEQTASALRQTTDQPVRGNPLQALEETLDTLPDWPVLIVLDNIEYWVKQGHFIQLELMDCLNVLLSFPNITLIISGEVLPNEEIQGAAPTVQRLTLPALNQDELLPLLKGELHHTTKRRLLDENLIHTLYEISQGEPWLLKTWLHLGLNTTVNIEALANELTQGDTPVAYGLSRFLYERLEPKERVFTHLLSMIQHPLDWQSLEALSQAFFTANDNTAPPLEKPSLLKSLLRSYLPPQRLLAELQQAQNDNTRPFHTPPPQVSFYRPIQQALQTLMPVSERQQLHSQLEAFYQAMASQPDALKAKRYDLMKVTEQAQWHQRQGQQLRGMLRDPQWVLSASPTSLEGPPNSNEKEPPIKGDPLRSFLDEDASDWLTGTLPSDFTRAETLLPIQQNTSRIDPEKANSEERSLNELLDRAFNEKSEQTASKKAELPAIQAHKVSAPSKPETRPASPADEDSLQQALQQAVGHPVQLAEALLKLAEHRINKRRWVGAQACLELSNPWKQLKSDKPAVVALEAQRAWQLLSIASQTQQAVPPIEPVLESLKQTKQLTPSKLLEGTYLLRTNQQETKATRWLASELPAFNSVSHSARETRTLASAWALLAEHYEKDQVLDLALEAHEQAIRFDQQADNTNGMAISHHNKARLHWQLKQWEPAVEQLSRAIELDKQSQNREGQWQGLRELATLYQQLRQLDKAKDKLTEALTLANDSPLWLSQTYFQLGKLHQQHRQWYDSLTAFEQALKYGRGILAQGSLQSVEQACQHARQQVASSQST